MTPELLKAIEKLLREVDAHLDYEDDEDMAEAADAVREELSKLAGVE